MRSLSGRLLCNFYKWDVIVRLVLLVRLEMLLLYVFCGYTIKIRERKKSCAWINHLKIEASFFMVTFNFLLMVLQISLLLTRKKRTEQKHKYWDISLAIYRPALFHSLFKTHLMIWAWGWHWLYSSADRHRTGLKGYWSAFRIRLKDRKLRSETGDSAQVRHTVL